MHPLHPRLIARNEFGRVAKISPGAAIIHVSPHWLRPADCAVLNRQPATRQADSPAPRASRRTALLLPNLATAGAETCMLRTVDELLRRGFRVDLVLCERSGPLLEDVPSAALAALAKENPR